MQISIYQASGDGNTHLAAFDTALREAGIANYNLVRLSSIIPPGTEIITNPTAQPTGDWGDKLYCVYAAKTEDKPGHEAWAGLGWVIAEEDGRGLFVEHTGASQAEVEEQIRGTLGTMVVDRGYTFGEIQTVYASAKCVDKPVAAITLAFYESEGWAARS